MLLQQLLESAEAAPRAEAPLALWLLRGALHPWHDAARSWAFSAAPSAALVRSSADCMLSYVVASAAHLCVSDIAYGQEQEGILGTTACRPGAQQR